MAYWRTALTLATARTRVRQRADMENSEFVTTDELDFFINNRAEEERALLIALNQDLLREEQTVALVAGTAEYTLTSDVWQCMSAKVTVGTEKWPLESYEDDEIETTSRASYSSGELPRYRLRIDPGATYAHKIKFNPPPAAAGTVTVAFLRPTTVYADATDSIHLPFPDYYVVGAAIDCVDKEKGDASGLRARLAEIVATIRQTARDAQRQPKHIRDARALEEEGMPREWR